MSTPVTVVIPHYGDPGHALSLIDDLRSQSYSGPLAIRVADDCSPTPFPPVDGVRVIRRDTNGGFSAAVNSGAQGVISGLLLILNSDLTIDHDFIDVLVRRAAPHLPAICGCRVDTGAGPVHTGQRFPSPQRRLIQGTRVLDRWRARPWLSAYRIPDDRHPGRGDHAVGWLNGAVLLVPIDVWNRLGGFDESFFMYFEETDLQFRAAELGYPAISLHEPVAKHAGGASSRHGTEAWFAHGEHVYATRRGHLGRALAAGVGATLLNLPYDVARRVRNNDVHPLRTARDDFRYLRQVAQGRDPRSGAPD